MFRFGIVSKDQIPTKVTERSDRQIAVTLLDEFRSPLTDIDEARLALIYSTLQVGPRTWMTTYPHRFDAVDAAIEEALLKFSSGSESIRVREFASSNGITALELFERLKHQFGERVSVRVTDYRFAFHVVDVPGSHWQIVIDSSGEPLQFIRGRIVLSAYRESKKNPANWLLQKALSVYLIPKSKAAPSRRIEVFHPRCLALAGIDSHFSLGQEDIFAPERTHCEVARVMNFAYRVERWLPAIAELVVDGGLLILGGDPLTRHAPLATTIFQKRKGRFAVLRSIGGGYPHQQSVLDLSC